MNETARSSLIFDWKHRPRTWLPLVFFLGLALVAHLAFFYLFSVRMPVPTRAMPLPASVSLAPGLAVAGLPAADPMLQAAGTGLDLPEIETPERYAPSFEGHRLPRHPWPDRPDRLAWPALSGLTDAVLPPAAPGNP